MKIEWTEKKDKQDDQNTHVSVKCGQNKPFITLTNTVKEN